MGDDILELFFIIDNCIIHNNGDAVDPEFSWPRCHNAEVELFRVNIGDDNVIDECLELLSLARAVDLLALGEFLQQALCNDVHINPQCYTCITDL